MLLATGAVTFAFCREKREPKQVAFIAGGALIVSYLLFVWLAGWSSTLFLIVLALLAGTGLHMMYEEFSIQTHWKQFTLALVGCLVVSSLCGGSNGSSPVPRNSKKVIMVEGYEKFKDYKATLYTDGTAEVEFKEKSGNNYRDKSAKWEVFEYSKHDKGGTYLRIQAKHGYVTTVNNRVGMGYIRSEETRTEDASVALELTSNKVYRVVSKFVDEDPIGTYEVK